MAASLTKILSIKVLIKASLIAYTNIEHANNNNTNTKIVDFFVNKL